MRLPNSFGNVVKLTGKRRKPYGARVTVGWLEGKQIRKYIGYYSTKKEALAALADYNKSPYDLDARTITFADVWEHWKKGNWDKGTKNTQIAWGVGFKHCEPLHDMKMMDIKLKHLETLVEDKGTSTQILIKSTCHKVFKYALKHEWVHKNPVSDMDVEQVAESEKNIFTKEEIDSFWKLSETDEFYELLLILIYTGMRVGELLTMKQANVHEDHMIGGTKTKAGKDRLIPIHSRIRPFIRKRLDGQEYLVNNNGKHVTYPQFRTPFVQKVKGHTIHETRHTFISNLHSAGVNETTIKIIVGHARKDVTGKVYIHKMKDELVEAVERLD